MLIAQCMHKRGRGHAKAQLVHQIMSRLNFVTILVTISDLLHRGWWVKVQTVPPYIILCLIIYLMSPMQRLLRCYQPGKLSITCHQFTSHVTLSFVHLLYEFRWLAELSVLCQFCIWIANGLDPRWGRFVNLLYSHVRSQELFLFHKENWRLCNQPALNTEATNGAAKKSIKNDKGQSLDIGYPSLFMNSRSYYLFWITYSSYHANHPALFFINISSTLTGFTWFSWVPWSQRRERSQGKTHTRTHAHALNAHTLHLYVYSNHHIQIQRISIHIKTSFYKNTSRIKINIQEVEKRFGNNTGTHFLGDSASS